MPKARLSTLDVAAEVSCLRQRVLGMRLSNVYDINAKTYLLKLARSGEDGEKVFVVLEAGVRLHSTQYMRDKNTIPSNFTLKLRKHLRSRRLEDVRQLGVDRIVMLSFGSGEAAHHLILEMYSQGNLVLTDAQFQVMTLLRSHRDDNKGIVIMPRHAYPMHSVRLLQPLQPQQLQQHLQDAKPQTSLKKAVGAAVAFGTPMVAEHCLLEAGLDPNREAAADPLMEQELQALLAALRRVEAWLTTCSSTEADAIPGFILLRSTSSGSAGAGSGAAPASSTGGAADVGPYEDCLPLLPMQMRDRGFAQFDTFDAALDEFFSKLEGQRAERAEAQAQKTMLSKVDKIRRDHEERIHALKEEAGTAERKARVLERELELVDAAINAVNAALADGMDWMRLQRMVREERERGNPVAAAIHSLDLDHNRATLLLPAPSTSSSDSASDSSNGAEESGDSGRGGASAADRGRKQAAAERARSPVKVEVDLALSAYANAALHYSSKKRHKQKEERTLAVQESVLKTAAVKQQKQVGQVAQRAASKAIQQMRKPMWFEKFNWFVSSENVLVVSGRDVQQNELLVKRHLHAGDAYVHADLHGAPSMVVKNPGGGSQPLPLLTLQEAGCACVCRSKAWDQKIVTSAWWVYDHQVSKTPPSGEYLPAGSFMIRGKKNFLPPSPLVMGLAVLFKLEDSCVAAHAGERAPRSGSMPDGAGAAAEDPVKEQPELDAEAEQAVPGEREEPDERREPDGEEEEEEEGEEEGEEGEDSEQGSNGEEGELDDMLDSLLTLRPSPAAPQAGGAAAERGASLDSSGSQQAELYERYHLEEGSTSHAVAAAVAEEEAQGSKGAQPRGKRYLTARERRLMKKGLWQPGRPLPEQPPPEAKPDADAAATEAGVAGSEPAAAEQKADWQPQRGKRGKEKKRRDKYGDQDDEDRELAMSVLLSAMPQKDRNTRRAERKAKKGAKREAAAAPVAQPGLQEAAIAAALGPLPAAAAGQERSAPDRTGGKDATRTRPAANTDSDAEEDSHAPEQDEAELSSEASGAAASQEVRERLAQLNSLTGAPLAEDVLLFAVPVCAPYAALASYKYKVKLVPGSQKKGKAAKQALELVLRNPDVRPQERELMRVIPDPEMVAAMVGNVKIASAGIQKVRQDSKKKGKLAC